MKTIPAGEFKAHCLKMMDRVNQTREPVVITKRGRPVVKLVAAAERDSDIFGCLAGVMKIVGDIESPAAPLEGWDALR